MKTVKTLPKLSGRTNDATGTVPSSYYRTRVDLALALLEQAALQDLGYTGDMLAEGVREGVVTAAILIVQQLAGLCRDHDAARLVPRL